MDADDVQLDPVAETPVRDESPLLKGAIIASLLAFVAIIWFAPRGGDASPPPGSLADPHGAPADPASDTAYSGYRGPGPRFAEPRTPPLSPYEEAQRWAEGEEDETPPTDAEAPPTL